ncbi:helix-turn-helix domain-containing protein [Mycobacteroides abscessus subsp. bolletii]|uniref:helix-turn-helix domain-containing protein n=1 Tax=Mycobacteroides abscessus TaxID=36809 RepID=UPI00266D3D96|nr:helix-turn-helix domain-containing protein [Mycobacteroides abscessus]MDO3129650.1 helix-turn-helix domain-containing protein [Mycobacteroides abscessus subsp. bolletii]
MSEFMSSSEVAQALGVSERRVRAMVADGQLPAQRMFGRWAVPASAVAAHKPASAGRPLSSSSAWSVLGHLVAGQPLPPRLNHRVGALRNDDDPLPRVRGWMARRGEPVPVWAFGPVLEELRDDDRVVVSGDRAVSDLESDGPLRMYAASDDVDDLLADYKLREVHGDRLPNAVIWAVPDLKDVPRDEADPHHAAPVVAALDLLDEGDPRAESAALGIIRDALEMNH